MELGTVWNNDELTCVLDNTYVDQIISIVRDSSVSEHRKNMINSLMRMSKDEAEKELKKKDIPYTISFYDGKYCSTHDIIFDRVSLCIDNGVVVKAFFG